MRLFNQWLDQIRSSVVWDTYAHVGRPIDGMDPRDAIVERLREGCPPHIEPQDYRDSVDALAFHPAYTLTILPLAGMVAGGVHAFAPAAAEFYSMAELPVSVPWSEYRQPFPTFVLVVPEGAYTSATGDHAPVAVIAQHQPETGYLRFSTIVRGPSDRAVEGKTIAFGMYPFGAVGRPADEIAEDFLTHTPVNDLTDLPDHVPSGVTPPSGMLTDDEVRSAAGLVRAAMNACLLMVNHGRKLLGPPNPQHAAFLRTSLAKKHLKDSVRRANTRALAAMPIMYALDLDITFDPREPEPKIPNDPTGRTQRFLGRRGHYARQTCGPGGTLRKWIYRCPLPPNPAHFAGDASDIKTVHNVDPAATL